MRLRELLLMIPGSVDIQLDDNGRTMACNLQGTCEDLLVYLKMEILNARVTGISPRFGQDVLWIIVNTNKEDEDDEG